MYKYLYIYNYSPQEQELCEMEFKQIFHEDMLSKYYLTNHFFEYTRSVFIKGRLDIIYSSSNFDEIIQKIKDKEMVYYEFKVIYLKNDITHVDYQDSLQRCRDIADPIDGTVNMQEPKVVFAVTKINDTWYFGIYNDDALWSERYNKPHSYSHSLNVRDARTIVNIAVGNDASLKIVDPCCGIGTVVLEALSMGMDVEGYDINRDVAYQARLNLEHFGYDKDLVKKQDIHTLDKHYDVTIMDMPYGVYSPFSYQQQLSLLKASLSLAPRFLLVSHIPFNKELEDLGYTVIDRCSIKKGNFQRYMTLCFQK
ncbi:MAG: hypothetical protein RR630_04795 [Coprobacillus sp.]